MNTGNRKHNLDKYTELIKLVTGLGYSDPKKRLADWAGCHRNHITKIFAGERSFSPRQMDAILSELMLDRSDAARIFPPFGVAVEREENEKIKKIKQVLEVGA